jgi:hypothetical protein
MNELTTHQQLPRRIEPKFSSFWSVKTVSNELRLIINRDLFVDCLNNLGLYKFYSDNLTTGDYLFVVVRNNIIRSVSISQIKDEFYKALNHYNDHDIFYSVPLGDGIKNFTLKDLKKALADNIEKLFNKSLLEILPPLDIDRLFKVDEETNYFFFWDAVVKITFEGITVSDWADLDGLVWENHIIPKYLRSFKADLEQTYKDRAKRTKFADFISKVVGDSPERIAMLRASMGYLTHPFMEGAMKAIYLTDKSSTSSTPNGRTGKTIIARAMTEVTGNRALERIVDGKAFNEKDQFKWAKVNFGDRMIALNDMDISTTAQSLFTSITEGIHVRKLHQMPFTVRSKLMFCNNKLLKGDGDSLMDRLVEIELDPFFSPTRRPNQVYNEYFFGLDWDRDFEKWVDFYCYMIECSEINLRLRKEGHDLGIVYFKTKSLEEKRLVENIPEEFLDFMDERIDDWANTELSKVKKEKGILSPEFTKISLAQDFAKEQNRKDTLSVKSLTKFLTVYCNYKGYKVEKKRDSSGRRKYFIIDATNSEMFKNDFVSLDDDDEVPF